MYKNGRLSIGSPGVIEVVRMMNETETQFAATAREKSTMTIAEGIVAEYQKSHERVDYWEEYMEARGGVEDTAFAESLADDYERMLTARWQFNDGSWIVVDATESHNSDGILPVELTSGI